MDPSWDAMWALFHQALEMDAEERAQWMAELATRSPHQAAELQALLAAHARDDGVLDRAPVAADDVPAFKAGDHVGSYVLLREIGRGGMGAVFEAERHDGEYRRRVALKLVAPERMHPGMLMRFRRERQIMAGLEHPNIARLLDGGTTREGWPYLVMEFIDGQCIDQWCVAHAAPLELRLRLLERIAEAVDYAHRHLIVHRDIKPGNVLVDSNGRPVLLDFGIAKLLESDPSASDATVQVGWRAMTPRYSSPEQLRGEAVSTATDIYALGVLLYELVAGIAPHAWQQQSPERLALRIERETPARLAQAVQRRLQQLQAENAPALAAEAARLRAESIPPELDWIARKAMAAQPDQRYPSALALADDLRRLRAHEPVWARAPSFGYRLRKSLRRHRLGYAIGLLFVLIVTALAARLGIESQRTRAALAESQLQRAHTDSVATFLAALFELADRTQAEGRDVSAREILDRGRERLAQQQELAPVVRARLLGSLARVYRNLGAYPVALQLLDEAGGLISRDPEPRLRAEWLRDRGSVLELQGANASARDALQESLSIFESLGAAQAIESARSAKLLAISLQSLGEREAAGRMFHRADADLNRLDGSSIDDRADSALRLGSWFWVAGDFESTTRHYARALSLRRGERPADLPELARTLDGNGTLAHALGRFAQAVVLFEEALALRRQVLGNTHRLTADTLSNYGATLFDQGQLEPALAHLSEAIGIYEQVLPPDSPVLAKTLNNLGLVRHQQRDFAAARSLFERALDIHRRALGASHPKLAANLNNLGLVEEQTGHLESAQTRFREALNIQEQALGAGHISTGFTLTNLGRLALWLGDRDAALTLLERARALRQELPEVHPLRADTDSWLGLAHCLNRSERERGRALIEHSIRAFSEQQALTLDDLNALRAFCLGADEHGGAQWQGHLAALSQSRDPDHPLLKLLRTAAGAIDPNQR